jgi:hypothetical protein
LQKFGEKGAHLLVCSRCLSRLLQYTLRSPALTVALHRSSRHQHAQCSLAYSLSPPDAGTIRTYQEMKFLYTHYNYIKPLNNLFLPKSYLDSEAMCVSCICRQYIRGRPALIVTLHCSSRHRHARCSPAYSLPPPDPGPTETCQEKKFQYTRGRGTPYHRPMLQIKIKS